MALLFTGLAYIVAQRSERIYFDTHKWNCHKSLTPLTSLSDALIYKKCASRVKTNNVQNETYKECKKTIRIFTKSPIDLNGSHVRQRAATDFFWQLRLKCL